MTNNYEVAEIIELGKAQDIVLGEKIIEMGAWDILTGEPNSRYIPATDD